MEEVDFHSHGSKVDFDGSFFDSMAVFFTSSWKRNYFDGSFFTPMALNVISMEVKSRTK